MAPADAAGIQESLLAPNAFDPSILAFLAKTGAPAAVGEFLTLTIGGETQGMATDLSGPAIVATGEYDVPFCGGNALRPYEGFPNIPVASKKLFPRARAYETVIGMSAWTGFLTSL